MTSPRTRYAKSGDVNIAYQVVGDGPFDLVVVPGFVSNVELAWEEPLYAGYLSRIASFARLILFDKRGTGLSDRVARSELPSLEDRMDDLTAVLREAGSEHAALVGHSEAGSLSILRAAMYPEETIALVTIGVFAKRVWSEDYPWAPTPSARAEAIASIESTWGTPESFLDLAPSLAHDSAALRRIGNYLRQSASPGDAAQLLRINTAIDVRNVLPTVRVPTLMLHRTGDRDANVEEGRWMSSQIPGAMFVELPGDDHLPWVGDADAVLDRVEEFLTGARGSVNSNRVLATVLFTDIVGSTTRATELGDQRWRQLLEHHDTIGASFVERYRGRVVKSTGDGLLAVFDGPARAVRCALAMRDALIAEGVEIRAGVHTGEIELRGADISGIAVHIAARIEALAPPGVVLVSRTIPDLVSGSGLKFVEFGTHILAGVPGEWAIYVPLS